MDHVPLSSNQLNKNIIKVMRAQGQNVQSLVRFVRYLDITEIKYYNILMI